MFIVWFLEHLCFLLFFFCVRKIYLYLKEFKNCSKYKNIFDTIIDKLLKCFLLEDFRKNLSYNKCKQ